MVPQLILGGIASELMMNTPNSSEGINELKRAY